MLKLLKFTMVLSSVRQYGTSKPSKAYKETVIALNSLQSNAAVIEKRRNCRDQEAQYNISKTLRYLKKVGINQKDLDSLNVIHVAGTKGKGSTCAFTESILRHHGYKTGLFTSPHLVAARERIRLEGKSISELMFATYFWEVYDKLEEQKESDDDLPAYFKFLTILAFHTFLKEKVDVAVIEVGIGGEYDCTNVVRKPIVCGITSLGLDHTVLLGNTIEQIAWHKAGIMKPDVPVFTVSHPPQAEAVLRSRAKYFNCDLQFCPSLSAYGWNNNGIHLGLAGEHHELNASLALQLSHTWIKHQVHGGSLERDCREEQEAGIFELPDESILGLRNCWWPGRNQILRRGNVVYYLDGAHTYESVLACSNWFSSVTSHPKDGVCRVLLFTATGDRDPVTLLTPLAQLKIGFDIAVFCPNIISRVLDAASDWSNYTVSQEKLIKNSRRNREAWIHLKNNTEISECLDYEFVCISEVLSWICGEACSGVSRPHCLVNAKEVHVLVTGSLHLVGNVLSLVDPELTGVEDLSVSKEVRQVAV